MNPHLIIIDGKAYVWREFVKLRREQLLAMTKATQPVLFELREDHRPLEGPALNKNVAKG